MAPASKDLFDDSTMSFGEHLEVLRMHLWKALIGVCVGVVVALFQGSTIIGIVRQPVDKALRDYGQPIADDTEALENVDLWQRLKAYLKDQFSLDALTGEGGAEAETEPVETPSRESVAPRKRSSDTIRVSVDAGELGTALHRLNPDVYPLPPPEVEGVSLALNLTAPEFRQFRSAAERANQVVALNVQEPFMTYLKVSMVSGLVLASPWVFYQLWLFVAAGLFPHERKFVYLYGSISAVLFIAGTLFCFYLVFPFVLRFLLGFNEMLKIQPQIRLSEWISFAVMLPLVFGVSFQLPLVMLLLERLGIVDVNDFREKRRLSILVIAIVSMMLTPADPVSMLMMMAPLVLLYELGIALCRLSPPKSPFESELTTT